MTLVITNYVSEKPSYAITHLWASYGTTNIFNISWASHFFVSLFCTFGHLSYFWSSSMKTYNAFALDKFIRSKQEPLRHFDQGIMASTTKSSQVFIILYLFSLLGASFFCSHMFLSLLEGTLPNMLRTAGCVDIVLTSGMAFPEIPVNSKFLKSPKDIWFHIVRLFFSLHYW